jgi:hypothetical protein
MGFGVVSGWIAGRYDPARAPKDAVVDMGASFAKN